MPILLLVTLGACTQTVRFPPDIWGGEWGTYYTDTYWTDRYVDTSDTAVPPQVMVTRVLGECDADKGTLSHSVLTDGWAGLATFTVFRALDGRFEDHVMSLDDLDPGGAWDRWEVGLTDGADSTKWLPGTSTAFSCATDGAALTYAVRLADVLVPDGPLTTVDCVVWGASQSAMTADLAARDSGIQTFDDCRAITL